VATETCQARVGSLPNNTNIYDWAGPGCDLRHIAVEKTLISGDLWESGACLADLLPIYVRPKPSRPQRRRLTLGPTSATVTRDHRRRKMVIDSLSIHPCFKTLDPEACRDLDRRCTWLKTPAGAWVAGQGENYHEVCFVLTGRLRVALHGARQDLAPSDIETGSFFGELSALEGIPNSLSAFAVEDSTLAKMPSSVFVATMFNHRPLGEAVVATLVVRNRAMTRKVAEAAHVHGDCLAPEHPKPGRLGQSRFDERADVCRFSANPRRARKWS
jgi:CRP-like cAMP-binding protein